MIQVDNLTKTFQYRDERGNKENLYALRHASFELENGSFCAIVGESGSGKSTMAQLLLGLSTPTEGTVTIDGEDIYRIKKNRKKELYSKIQLIMQDSKSSLDPKQKIVDSIGEPITNYKRVSKQEIRKEVECIANDMELPMECLDKLPDELSGGQQKRACMARALILNPKIVVFDEAITGLDVIVRRRILQLIQRKHKDSNGTYIFITHDMDVALYLASRIFVMKNGEIVEDVVYTGDRSVFQHEYSKQLLESI